MDISSLTRTKPPYLSPLKHTKLELTSNLIPVAFGVAQTNENSSMLTQSQKLSYAGVCQNKRKDFPGPGRSCMPPLRNIFLPFDCNF